MDTHFHVLNDVYISLSTGASPTKSTHELASTMFSCICELILDGSQNIHSRDAHLDRHTDPQASSEHCLDRSDLTCVGLTLVEKINSKLTSQSLSEETSLYFSDISQILYQEMGLMSKLVNLFHSKDRLTSHLAAKSALSYVLFELQSTNTVNQIWERKCLEVFQNPSPCNELDACLWSLTAVIKSVLKGWHGCEPETLERLIAAFDPACIALYSSLLPGERVGCKDSELYGINTTDWGTTLSILTDLLEVLTAARLKPGTGICFQSQRLTNTHASALLWIVTSQVGYFVKKQVLLLLKRTLLHKAGEDMALGEMSTTTPRDHHMPGDMYTLADDVLRAVDGDWLQCVPVESADVFFGGTSQLCDGSGDFVMSRAVSLVLLKSLEYKIKSVGGKGAEPAIDVPGYLGALLLFLGQRGVQLKQGSHSCSWVSLVFGEQDDDMIEGAKALLLLYLHHSRGSSVPDAATDDAACAVGGNPHCHFLFLLRSVSFDHSILLDFLISTETCFLEYLVRYLKHLRGDWEGFCAACRKMEAPDRKQRLPCGSVSGVSQDGGSGDTTGPDLVPSRLCPQPSLCVPPVSGITPASPLRLVDYGSSDESENEEMEVSDRSLYTGGKNAGPETFSSEEGGLKLSGFSSTQWTTSGQSGSIKETQSGQRALWAQTGYDPRHQTGSGPCTGQDGESGQNRLSPIQVTQLGQRLCVTGSTQDTPHSDGLSPHGVTYRRTVTCLSELGAVVARLHGRNLFPYNPTSLLKLLTQIETMSSSVLNSIPIK